MIVEEWIYQRLKDAQAVRETIPDDLAEGEIRLYPDAAPESTPLPLLIYTSADNVPTVSHDGVQASDQYTLDIEVWGVSKAQVKRLGRAVRQALHGYRGTSHGMHVQGVFLRGESDSSDLPQHGEDRGPVALTMNFELWLRPVVDAATPAT